MERKICKYTCKHLFSFFSLHTYVWKTRLCLTLFVFVSFKCILSSVQNFLLLGFIFFWMELTHFSCIKKKKQPCLSCYHADNCWSFWFFKCSSVHIKHFCCQIRILKDNSFQSVWWVYAAVYFHFFLTLILFHQLQHKYILNIY